jgi:hypothetical protein
MFGRKKADPGQPGSPYFPMAIANGYLTAGKQHAPTTAVDHEPREFQRIIDASGFKHVQANNGLWSRRGAGLMGPISYQNYLSQAQPIIPGQNRDNYAGFHKKGIDPQSYAQLWADGPGAQPVNPGGPGKIAANYYINPGTS